MGKAQIEAGGTIEKWSDLGNQGRVGIKDRSYRGRYALDASQNKNEAKISLSQVMILEAWWLETDYMINEDIFNQKKKTPGVSNLSDLNQCVLVKDQSSFTFISLKVKNCLLESKYPKNIQLSDRFSLKFYSSDLYV